MDDTAAPRLMVCIEDSRRHEEGQALAGHLGVSAVEAPDKPADDALVLKLTRQGLFLCRGDLALNGDFTRMVHRIDQNRWQHELLVKAARLKDPDHIPTALDCTAGLGEDSMLLAAAGFEVTLYERNPVIAALCRDAIRRAKKVPELKEAAGRMTLIEGESVEALRAIPEEKAPDVIYLDPMFPERDKSALTRKKFQLLHLLEGPALDEEVLLHAALNARPGKIVIKRPLKGPYAGGVRPAYSIQGKAVRFDCVLP